jgi:hypothetical protein
MTASSAALMATWPTGLRDPGKLATAAMTWEGTLSVPHQSGKRMSSESPGRL